MVTAKSRKRQNSTTTDLGLVEGLDELGGGGGGLLAAGLGEDELDLGQHLGLPDIHGGSGERQSGRGKGQVAAAAVAQASSWCLSVATDHT